jgi:protein ImuA
MHQPAKTPDIAAVVAQLAEAVGQLQERHRPTGLTTVSTGSALLDRLLPGGGLRRGSLVEWLAAGPGSGATTAALMAASQACRSGGILAVLDAQRSFYPPAIADRVVVRSRLLVIRPAARQDEAWALDQLLRQPGIAAVLAWIPSGDDRAFRRLQLAAEAGGGLGLLVRPAAARRTPCWASVRLAVQPLATASRPPENGTGSEQHPANPDSNGNREVPVPIFQHAARPSGNRRLCLKILHCRSSGIAAGPQPQGVHWELDETTGLVHESICTANSHTANSHAAHSLRLADALAAPAARRHARRA